MKRVVIFAAGYSEVGGAARRARVIASTLAERGWDVRVISRSGTLVRPGLRRSPGLTVLELPGFGRRGVGLALYVVVALPVGTLWARRASGLVAIQLTSTTVVAAICSLLSRTPYLALTTTSGAFGEAGYVRDGRFGRLRRWLVGRAAYLVAQTDGAARELVEILGAERVATVPNPVDVGAAPALNGRPRVLFTGRLSEEKDLFRLLDAWRAVVPDHSDAVLTLAGDGGRYRSVEDELHALSESDAALNGRVRFTGWVADVAPLLAESDVYVLPSVTEGMSNALLEACAAGRVVVASDIPSNREILGDDYPLLFPVGDVSALAGALARALDDGALRAAARAAVTARARAFATDVVVDRLESLLEDAAASGPGRRPRTTPLGAGRAPG